MVKFTTVSSLISSEEAGLDEGKKQWTDQLEQALLKVVIVLARIAHELCNGALALAQLAEVESAQLVQLPARQCRQPD